MQFAADDDNGHGKDAWCTTETERTWLPQIIQSESVLAATIFFYSEIGYNQTVE